MPQRGVYSVTVPGVVAGWDALRRKFGSKPFSELLAPAIFYAENGFPVSEQTAAAWANALKRHLEHPNSRKTFLVDDGRRTPRAGEVFRNPNLAWTYRQIATGGRDAFYKGEVAQRILATSASYSGSLSAADLDRTFRGAILVGALH